MIHYMYLAGAVVLEVAANLFIKSSNGFHRKLIGLMGIASVLASFAALSKALEGIDLSLAYALWGGTGIVLTTASSVVLYKEKLQYIGWLGIFLIVAGLVILKTA